mmetsp:Transcript_38957/g.154159  ORF Transcript_38957/g.154159 Transcript_38957/m.154159 type:complete len:254 (-) Transcript_38957:3993-4754(-)|eukprot:CAMPEP_0113965456 /NCGR_PEP_ID=MMETSP0011_2-20120614/7756_1 /TAXON_ID=101924 /ORGANISM="Rhodosorus marinus" /LENGTH=253 /DNA_ID=CAMNT_0000977973 /DNA_START=370 /DNA_END=1131 /DNA_ORIENTATION=+ /assembly_acc=CAM_ASM_000156
MAFFEEWFRLMPPVTRSYVALSVITTGMCALDMISPLKLYLNWTQILEGQVWRLLTNFFFFGKFGLDFLFHMFFLYRYCKLLEINSFRGKTADFLYMLIFGSTLLLAVSRLTPGVLFLGPSLTFMMVYVWGRRNERMAMNFLGLFNFRAPYLPWVLLLFSLILGSNNSSQDHAKADILGVIAGHFYYFLYDIYPIITGGKRILWTPRILSWLVGNNDEASAVAAAVEDDGQPGGQEGNRFGWGGMGRGLRGQN